MRFATVLCALLVLLGNPGRADGFNIRGGTDENDPSRLVGVANGTTVLDRVLRHDKSWKKSVTAGRVVETEEGTTESAWIADDGSAAVVATRLYRIDRPLDEHGGRPTIDPAPSAVTSALTWFDFGAPEGRWTDRPEPGWEIAAVEFVGGGRGVVVLLSDVGEDAELRVYDPGGRRIAEVTGLLATSFDVRQSGGGAFVAADVAFRAAPGLPSRSLLIADLERGTAWRYAWEYGSDEEPTSWELLDDGTVVIRNGFGDTRYDRAGSPSAPVRKAKRPR